MSEQGGHSIWLAPMEGLLDHGLRDTLTRVGGIDLCVSEFIRVTDSVLPDRAFMRVVPELRNGSRTQAGVPVRVQLLGSDPACLADNAQSLARLGPAGIDLNFGCPAKTVNRHRGGAVLLQEPELVGQIVAAVRRAVPAHIPVSAKMRLGYEDDALAEDCARAIEAGGASDLVVHARTKVHGYRPPAYWDRIADIRRCVKLPMVANGEIWSVQDAQRCREVTGCDRLMIGRGLVSDPGLALAIAQSASGGRAVPWSVIRSLMPVFWRHVCGRVASRHRAGRLKQWLNYLRRTYPEAQMAFDELRLVHDPVRIEAWMAPSA
ncbi:MAG: tRNA dihydrouridine synthase [Limnohabitans sp.]